VNNLQKYTYKKEYACIRMWLTLNLLLYITIECISSLDILERFSYLAMHLDIFLVNYILLLIITCPCLLFPKMPFVFNLFAVGILTITCASRILMIIRGLPLTWPDFFIAKEGLSIANKYLSPEILLLIIVLACMGLILLKKSYACRIDIHHPRKIVSFIIVITSLNIGIVSEARKIDNTITPEQSMDYHEEGMVYSFVSSYETSNDIVPEDYNEDNLKQLRAELNSVSVPVLTNKNPNIIFLQVESFIDPLTLKGITYSQDPIPNMRKYMTGDWSGYMEAPGINTARTEFEILTGIRIADLFKYEVPYTSEALDGRPIESIAQLLRKDKGYHTTAIHNNEASFYDRNRIYSPLGFNHFISLESMEGVEYTKNWPKDKVLLNYIEKTIQDTPNRDFIFTVTVGTHSSYDYDYEANESGIIISGDAEENVLNQTQDYIDRFWETDQFIGDLIDYVNNLEEPTILVAYGDHIPALDLITFDKTYIKNQTPYFVVSNYILRGKADAVIPAYRLYTQILNAVGIQGGIISSVHNAFKEEEEYFSNLDLVGYDMLIGSKYITEGKDIYQNTELQIKIP
jgi:hypothetical protein